MRNEDAGPHKGDGWGIIRYAPGSGFACDEDAAGFDGWYTNKADALEVFEDWRRRFPYWIVALVQQDLAWFGDGDFNSVRSRPLTVREQGFKSGELGRQA